MNINFEKIINEVCEEKNIKESQFLNYLNTTSKNMIEQAADRFINYCECDGWHYWNKNFKRGEYDQKIIN